MLGVADISNDAQRQLERAGRLLDFQPHRKTTPVHKSLEQHFSEARGQAPGVAAAAAAGLQTGQAPSLGGAGLGGIGLGGAAGAAHSRVLHGPKLQRLDREVEVFVLGPSSTAAPRTTPAAASATVPPGVAGATAASTGADTTASWLPPADEKEKDLGVAEFFGYRHEKVLMCAMEEAQRDCMRSFERHSFDRIQSDWAEAKAQIMASISPQGLGPAGTAGSTGSTTRGVAWGGGSDASHAVVTAPSQDAAIIDALLREPVSQELAQRIGRLSGDCCPPYRGELNECWGILAASLRPTPREVSCGALQYLQSRYAEELRAIVYRLPGTHLGGVPDAWCLVRELGRAKFGAMGFPNDPAHVWYAAFVAARAGFAQLLAELPTKAAPASERCPMFRSVCALMARRLLATATPEQQQPFTGGAGAATEDSADLLRADLSEEGNAFHDVLVSLLLNRSFSMGSLPEGTVEDWVWFRLHALNLGSKDSDQAPEFAQHMQAMRTHVSSLPAAHFDPPVVAGPGALGMSPGLGMDPLGMSMVGATAAAAGGAVTAQTLNLVKVLLLTSQFDKAVQQLWSQDRCLRAPALHMALTLHRAGTLKVVAGSQAEAPSIAGLVSDYASHFSCGDQLQYFRILDLRDRVQALQRMLLRGGVGTNDELLGYIDDYGGHQPGLLERTLHEEGLGDTAEFTQLCATAGFAAAEHGQYREAIRLLHLGGRHGEVLQVLCRCLRLPIWREPAAAASEEAARLGQDIQRFFAMYERKLDAYGIHTQDWAVARKLYAARLFHGLCESGQPEAAVDLFDREQLLPLSPDMPIRGEDMSPEALAEYPRIVSDYVRILRHAASQGLLVVAGLRERLQKLQSFLAMHSHHLALDQETVSILAGLALS